MERLLAAFLWMIVLFLSGLVFYLVLILVRLFNQSLSL
jgi:hypothetical protein